ncbi:DUF4157 domain-containing protein [Paenibacillus alginolyticus]|uniref:eCIS core domain-containing protein n=1 Tax=Paenibacillus alginolyticus TaxID=59839 RepID=UPI00042793D3|nr:DUF4157 domain-containing protein [Paenibacillus alginolyticus]MCY9667297.1 DUF4157 domain-containing protein [Paenibacillus alginolyticus]
MKNQSLMRRPSETSSLINHGQAAYAQASMGQNYIHNLHKTVGNRAVAQMMRAGLQANPMQTVQSKTNRTGLPDDLKSGVESLSGISLDDVKVHYNSSKPAQLQAHAYAEGTDIHVAPGQDQHLPHEAWHVVQQKQGLVKPMMQMGGVAINDDAGLEQDADIMGARALQQAQGGTENSPPAIQRSSLSGAGVVQRMLVSSVKKSNGDEEEKQVNASDLGESNVIFKEYAQFLENDSSAYVKGEVKKGIAGLKKVLNEAEVDAGELKESFIAGLIQNGLWKEAKDSDFDALRTQISTLYPDFKGVDEYTNQETIDYCKDDPEPLQVWLEELITLTGDKVSDFVAGAASLTAGWKNYLAYVLYDKAKVKFYDMTEEFVPFVQPFIQLIEDINANRIDSLDYVRKYGNNPANYGAEFEVAGPAEMVTKYDDKAVVHTHYDANNAQPNYGHTKPYDKRYETGYGYTVVNLPALLGMDDTQKTYNAL